MYHGLRNTTAAGTMQNCHGESCGFCSLILGKQYQEDVMFGLKLE